MDRKAGVSVLSAHSLVRFFPAAPFFLFSERLRLHCGPPLGPGGLRVVAFKLDLVWICFCLSFCLDRWIALLEFGLLRETKGTTQDSRKLYHSSVVATHIEYIS